MIHALSSRYFLYFLGQLFLSFPLSGQGPAGILRGLHRSVKPDVWQLWNQPDQLAPNANSMAAAGSWYRWQTVGAGESMLALQMAVPGGVLALGIEYASFGGFHEKKHLIGFGKSWPRVSIGIQIQHRRFKIENRKSDLPGYVLSGSYQLKKDWWVHLRCEQHLLPDHSWQKAVQFPVLQGGFTHDLFESLQLNGGLVFSPAETGIGFQGGLIYHITHDLAILSGYTGSQNRLGVGLEYGLKKFKVQFYALHQNSPGTTYWMGLCTTGFL